MPGAQKGTGVQLRDDLTELARELDFSELNLCNSLIAPSVSVPSDTGRYPSLPREASMKLWDTKRQADGSYQRGAWEWSDDTYVCYEYGFEEPVDNVTALINEKFMDEEEESAARAYEALHLGRESRVASALLNTTLFTGDANTGAITNEWDDSANCTPYADIDAACKVIRGKTGLHKGMMVVMLTDDLLDYALRSAEVKDYAKYNNLAETVFKGTEQVRAQLLANYFGVKQVVVTRSLYDTSKLGSDASIGKFWSNEYIMVGLPAPKNCRLKDRGLIKQLVFSKYSDDYIMESYAEPSHNREIIRCREFRGIKVNVDYGYLLTNAKTTVDATTNI